MKYLMVVLVAISLAACYKTEVECVNSQKKTCWYSKFSYQQCEFDSNGSPIFFHIENDTTWSEQTNCSYERWMYDYNLAINDANARATGVDSIFRIQYKSTCGCYDKED